MRFVHFKTTLHMKKTWMFLLLFGGLNLAGFAQEATEAAAVTDEDLKKSLRQWR